MILTGQNATIVAGDNAQLQFTVTSDGTSSGAAVTCTAASWAMSDRAGGTSLVTETTTGGGAVISGGSSQVITVTLSTTDTDQTPGKYYHELQVTTGSNILTVASGTITILPDQAT